MCVGGCGGGGKAGSLRTQQLCSNTGANAHSSRQPALCPSLVPLCCLPPAHLQLATRLRHRLHALEHRLRLAGQAALLSTHGRRLEHHQPHVSGHLGRRCRVCQGRRAGNEVGGCRRCMSKSNRGGKGACQTMGPCTPHSPCRRWRGPQHRLAQARAPAGPKSAAGYCSSLTRQQGGRAAAAKRRMHGSMASAEKYRPWRCRTRCCSLRSERCARASTAQLLRCTHMQLHS